jgi:adenylate cyclase
MSQSQLTRRLAAIMSLDVVGYSAMMGKDEAGTYQRLTKLRQEFLEPTLADYGGRVVKLMGDGALVEFSSCVDAVECGLAMQDGISSRNADLPDYHQITFRVGINLGEVIVDGEDLYGEGVNIAARIESVAEPGGVAVSGSAWDQVEGKVVAVFESCGPQELKNIATPITIYRWPNDAQMPGSTTVQAGTGLGLPDKPAIMVLPFQNRSRDPDEEMFVDGITEDLLGELSKFSSLFVISRHSSFAYKSRQVSPAEIRRELGVRYLVEGSIRRAGGRVRASVQLTDTKTGGNLWSGRFDREAEDIFDVEDELVQEIVAALPDRIYGAESDRVKRMPPKDMRAYDYVVAGRALQKGH